MGWFYRLRFLIKLELFSQEVLSWKKMFNCLDKIDNKQLCLICYLCFYLFINGLNLIRLIKSGLLLLLKQSLVFYVCVFVLYEIFDVYNYFCFLGDFFGGFGINYLRFVIFIKINFLDFQ